MRARVIRIGNSRGLRIPKALLDQCQIEDLVDVTVVDGKLTVTAIRAPRAGWGEAARQMAARGEDGLIDPPTLTAFDDSEWQWPNT